MGIVSSLHNKEESSFGNSVLEVLQIASTLWPISFAAVMGPFLRTLALYGAEKGSSLGVLEFLSTSQTTASALLNFLTLGTSRAWTVAVAAAWCLSPLGGQSAVRSLSLHTNSSTVETPAMSYLGENITELNYFYTNPNAADNVGIFYMRSIASTLISGFRNNIRSAFSNPDIIVSNANGSSDNFADAVEAVGGSGPAITIGQQDQWRNVRVPFIELLPGYDEEDPHGWVDVPIDQVVSYASHIGHPIRGGSFARAGNSSMVVPAHYQTVSCGDWFDYDTWPGRKRLFLHEWNTSWVSDFALLARQYQYDSFDDPTYPNVWIDIVTDNITMEEHATWNSFNETAPEPTTKLPLIFGSGCTDKTVRVCNMSTSYVDMRVNCTRLTASVDQTCQATSLRHRAGYPVHGNLTAFSNYAALNGYIWELPKSTAVYDIATPSLVEQYIYDPTAMLAGNGTMATYCYANTSRRAFENRFATVINTVVMASLNSEVITGGDGASLQNRNVMWHETTATWTEFSASVYAIDKLWYSLWVVCTAVMLLSAIANVAVRVLIRAPDFMDGVAGLTRDSRYVHVPQGGAGRAARIG